MFTGKTREKQQEQKKAFSQDIKARCSLVVKELLKIYAGDTDKIKKQLPAALRATLSCYKGDCSSCRRHSYVCSGGASSDWWLRSMFLATHGIRSLSMTENDEQIVMEILKMKLSVEAMELLKLGTSTQKCEALNRSISVSLPKNVNFSKNVTGRLASTIHRCNNGVQDSAEKKLAAVGVQLSMRAKSALNGMQKEETYQKAYGSNPETVKRRLVVKQKTLKEHLQYKREKHAPKHAEYQKGQLDYSIIASSSSEDHVYRK